MCYVKDLIGLGLQFFILQIACLIIFSTSNILISHLFSPNEVTPYNIAFKYFNVIIMFFGIIMSPFWTAITDAYVRKERIWIEKNINRLMKIEVVCIVCVIFMVFISKYVFSIWIGDIIEISYSLSISLAIYTIINLWNQIFASVSNGTGRLKVQLFCSILAAITYIPIAIFLSKFWGIAGLVYAMSIVLSFSAIGLYIDYRVLINKMKWI
jgi:O-antigen/teichoic acid export membrane protein